MLTETHEEAYRYFVFIPVLPVFRYTEAALQLADLFLSVGECNGNNVVVFSAFLNSSSAVG